jgi:hypothetical protein
VILLGLPETRFAKSLDSRSPVDRDTRQKPNLSNAVAAGQVNPLKPASPTRPVHTAMHFFALENDLLTEN